MKNILVIPHLRLIHANALSSPLTIGFPAITAWLGAVHALQRRLNRNSDYAELRFVATAVVAHEIDLQVERLASGFGNSIIGTGNPLNAKGERAAFIESPRCHLTVSLMIEFQGLGLNDRDEFVAQASNLIHTMKFAGGDVLSFRPLTHKEMDGSTALSALMRQVMPGHFLIERRDLVESGMKDGLDALEAILAQIQLVHTSAVSEDDGVEWRSERKSDGWIVPISVGYQGLTELGHAKNQRDPHAPHRFAESVISLGEFVMPHRITDMDHVMWRYETDLENDLYLCRTLKQRNETQLQQHGGL
jgi:CRISPR-associated protein Csy2